MEYSFAQLDESSFTGESKPVSNKPRDSVYTGTVNRADLSLSCGAVRRLLMVVCFCSRVSAVSTLVLFMAYLAQLRRRLSVDGRHLNHRCCWLQACVSNLSAKLRPQRLGAISPSIAVFTDILLLLPASRLDVRSLSPSSVPGQSPQSFFEASPIRSLTPRSLTVWRPATVQSNTQLLSDWLVST